MRTDSRETPIERIFREVMGRKMPLSLKVMLLRKSSAQRKAPKKTASDAK